LAELKAVKHIVDYYYRTAGRELPIVESDSPFLESNKATNKAEAELFETIAHHFACDEIDFCSLYDACSLLDNSIEVDRSYRRVILAAAHQMRKRPQDFGRP
jgi:hypothetical protein